MSEITINNEIYILTKKEKVNASNITSDWNTGYRNTGNCNTGYRNTGDWNTGNCNTGNWNTGNWNTGDCNTGYRNTGDWNTGNCNTGNWNTGNRNTGNCNTGNWNTGYRNTGFFNTNEPKVRIFNKETNIKREDLNFPRFIRFDLTQWIYEEKMTPEEKVNNPTYKTTGGYLKSYEYKEAFRNSWNKSNINDRKKILLLPNFDNDIFLEISGIDVAKELNLL